MPLGIYLDSHTLPVMQNTVAVCFCSIISPIDIKYYVDMQTNSSTGGVKGFLVLFIAKECVFQGCYPSSLIYEQKYKEFTPLAVNCFKFSRKNFLFSSTCFHLSDFSCQGLLI